MVFQTNHTYVIDSDITLDSDTTMPSHVTLVFQGGKIISHTPVILRGYHTRIVAPICQIFGDKVTVEGTWDIDRAYPQWFNCRTFADPVDYHTTMIFTDAGLAINRAIKMKQKGEVFLQKGIYIIITPIYVPIGIKLTGERGMDPNSKNPPGTDLNFQGTVLQSWRTNDMGAITDDDKKFMIYVNTIPDTTNSCTGLYSDYKSCQITEISSMCIYNNICTPEGIGVSTAQAVQGLTTACMGGIFSNEIVKIDHVRFCNFRKAVVYAQDYTDTKSITNCDYVCNGKYVYGINIYDLLDNDVFGFDFGFLGDATLFSHNTVSKPRYNKALCLNRCGSGLISANIINGDIEILSSKGVVLECNHLEEGTQIEITESVVSFRNNFFEKRYRPTVCVYGNVGRDDNPCYSSVVSFDGDMFIYYEEVRDNSVTNVADYYNNICQWDIAVDPYSIVDVKNTYRQRIPQYSDMRLFGIQICKAFRNSDSVTFEDFPDFNDYSYALSSKGRISMDFLVEKNFNVTNFNTGKPRVFMINEQVKWFGPDGYYWYSGQVICDKRRRLVRITAETIPDGLFPFHFSEENQDCYLLNSLEHIGSSDITNGVLLLFQERLLIETPTNGQNFILRLFRYENQSPSCPVLPAKYVDIPICGSLAVLDNGLSVCGYQWKPYSNNILTRCIQPKNVTFLGENVRCLVTNKLLNSYSSGWEKGDVLINAGNDTSWSIDVI